VGTTVKRLLAFLFGGIFVVAGGGGAAVSVYGVLEGNGPVLLVFGVVGGTFALLGAVLVSLAVVDTDRWAEDGGLDTSGSDPGPGWGGDE
jgi:hypothetical protein